MQDVIIIGAGVIGASIFRELTKYNMKITMIDSENDVSVGTTKANSAIVHAGFDPKEGTLMAKLNLEGNILFEDICAELKVPFKRNGSLVLAFCDDEIKRIKAIYENGLKIGVKGLEIIDKKRVLEMEPNISNKVIGALYARTGGIVSPYEYTIALAENGVANGGEILLNSEVVKIKKDGMFKVTTSLGKVLESKYIVNAAGLYADKVHNLICKKAFTIIPRKGEYYVLDKEQGELFTHTIFQCPSEFGKGILVTPTVHGNLLVGPNAKDIEDKEDLRTTGEALNNIKEAAMKTTDNINFREVIKNFAGLRATSDRGDFIVEEAKDVKGFIDVAGMKSPGLSSAPAVALEVIKLLEVSGLTAEKNTDFKGSRKSVVFNEITDNAKNELIRNDSTYGRVICRCENITEGEIIDAINRSFGNITVDGVKRRCRPGMGRCQGGFCGPKVQEIIARELNKDIVDICQDKEGSYILVGKTR
jgi:glycerol-3-phosphate dehydrogenase